MIVDENKVSLISYSSFVVSVQNLKSQLVQRVQSVQSDHQSTNDDDSGTSHKLQRTYSENVATRVRLA